MNMLSSWRAHEEGVAIQRNSPWITAFSTQTRDAGRF
jgi:hypothetical protein